MMKAHVIPRNDLVQHTVDEDCVCGPTPELVPDDEPPWNKFATEPEGDRWLIVHHALDGREHRR